MRYVVLGAGAVGGAVGALLHADGQQVSLVARGEHLEALRRHGLELRTPAGSQRVAAPTVGQLAELDWSDEQTRDTVVLLTVKSQDTQAALDQLDAVAPPSVPVVCVQNGVDNERQALRRRPGVYAVPVLLPATYLEPGVVELSAGPVPGVLDVGRYPYGVDELAIRLSSDLESAGFASRPDPQVMALKYRKLLRNLANALEAACGPQARGSELADRAVREGLEVFEAAGLRVADEQQEAGRRRLMASVRPQPHAHGGGSSWQSLARGTGRIEADFLNGEVVLLGRLHAVATPVNELLASVAGELARGFRPPGSLSVAELEARLTRAPAHMS